MSSAWGGAHFAVDASSSMSQENQKEANRMTRYQKPELVTLANASEAIQNMAKTAMANDAAPPHQPPATASAYEADE